MPDFSYNCFVNIKKLFHPYLIILILLHFSLHLYSTNNGNFYFTVDQGRDALNIREILNGKIILVGPRTGAIENLFVGPYWYYLIAPGFLIFGGDPYGGVLVMIVINAITLILVFNLLKKYTSLFYSFLITLGLLIFERFWFSSQFSLNPHLLPLLTFGFVISLIKLWEGNKKYLIAASIFCGMVIHSELAFVPIIFIPLIVISLYLLFKKIIVFKDILMEIMVFLFFLIPHIIYELTNNFSQTKAIFRAINEPKGIIGETTYLSRITFSLIQHLKEFSKIIIPQNEIIGVVVFIFLILFLQILILKKHFNRSYFLLFQLTIFMVIISILWFSLTKEFLPWHALGLYSLVFIVIVLGLSISKARLAKLLFFIIFFLQVLRFIDLYPKQLVLGKDNGLFIHQLNAVDWIYENSGGTGFYVYSYLQFVYDYTYQYTIWWRGIKKYDYLPCEYSTYPNIPSSLYFKPIDNYQDPKRECENIQYLIIEPTNDKSGFETWYKGVSKNTELIEQKSFGNIKIEKRLVKSVTVF